MKKALRIVSVVSGIVCAVSAAVLAFVYLEEAIGRYHKIKNSVSSKISERKTLEEEFEGLE